MRATTQSPAGTSYLNYSAHRRSSIQSNRPGTCSWPGQHPRPRRRPDADAAADLTPSRPCHSSHLSLPAGKRNEPPNPTLLWGVSAVSVCIVLPYLERTPEERELASSSVRFPPSSSPPSSYFSLLAKQNKKKTTRHFVILCCSAPLHVCISWDPGLPCIHPLTLQAVAHWLDFDLRRKLTPVFCPASKK